VTNRYSLPDSFDHVFDRDQINVLEDEKHAEGEQIVLDILHRRFAALCTLRDEIANAGKEHSQKINTLAGDKEGSLEQRLTAISANQDWLTLKLVEVVEKLELITYSVHDLLSYHADEIANLEAEASERRESERKALEQLKAFEATMKERELKAKARKELKPLLRLISTEDKDKLN
jgi:hypothetical protein